MFSRVQQLWNEAAPAALLQSGTQGPLGTLVQGPLGTLVRGPLGMQVQGPLGTRAQAVR